MMQKRCLWLLLLLCWYMPAKAQSAKKTVFIIVDGIPADVIEKLPTPHLDQIAKAGRYTRAYMGGEKGGYSETPTISAVGYNSLLTGTWANKHNVWDNAIKAPNYHYWTIFRLLKTQYPEKKTAIFSTWLDNRTKLIGEGLSETGNIKLDYHFDGFELDTNQFPHDQDRKFISLIDQHVTDEAARYIKQQGPDLSWIYLEYPDDMGHRYGDSQQFYDAVVLADQQVGQIWESIQYRQTQHQEEWLIVVTTDHGRDADTGKHHGGQSERERTIWITTNAAGLNSYFHKSEPAMVDIMPTVARFMELKMPEDKVREMDGVPLIGPVSLTSPKAFLQGNTIQVSWQAIEKKGKLKVWLSDTNQFKENGQSDTYILKAEVPLAKEKYAFKLDQPLSGFYKIVLEGPHNSVNQWIMTKK